MYTAFKILAAHVHLPYTFDVAHLTSSLSIRSHMIHKYSSKYVEILQVIQHEQKNVDLGLILFKLLFFITCLDFHI